MKCPLCSGTIKKIKERADNRTKDKVKKNHLIKCEHNVFKDDVQSGCKFMFNLSPVQLNGYIFTREEVETILGGGEVVVNDIKASFNVDKKYNPFLVFPEMEDF